MSVQSDNPLNLIKPFGLSSDEGRVYLDLISNGFSSALLITRRLHIGRTKVYRLLDKLKAKQLVELKLDERGMKFGATSPKKFEQLLIENEQKISSLRKSLPSLLEHLHQLTLNSPHQSKVLYYKGIEGLKQVSYNLTKADKLLRVFEMEHLSEFLPEKFAEAIRQTLVEREVVTHDLTNKRSFPGFTNVNKMITSFSQFRYINPDKLKINFEVLIYNDVYVTYTYKNKDIFCVEIYNRQLAKMQKQLFDFVWEQASVMEFTDLRGGARVKSQC